MSRSRFPASRFADPAAERLRLGESLTKPIGPIYRVVTCPQVDGRPNPDYGPRHATAYAAAKSEADAYCRRNG